MKTLRFLLAGLYQTLFFVAAGQTNATDSMLRIVQENKHDMAEARALNALAVDYARTDMGKAKACLYRSMEITVGADMPVQLSSSYAQMSTICENTGQPDSAAHYLNLLKKLAETSPSVRSNYVQAAGLYYKRQNNIKAALPYMLGGLKIAGAGQNRFDFRPLKTFNIEESGFIHSRVRPAKPSPSRRFPGTSLL